MATNTKRMRNSTHLLSNLLHKDKPADKFVKLELCLKCESMVSDNCIGCNWCSCWEDSGCANVEKKELVLLHGATSLNVLFICSSCLTKLPATLNLETALTITYGNTIC